MSTIPDDPNALLSRDQTARALTDSGFQTEPTTLATKATRGGGPPYRLFGARALYRWGEVLAWAESRLSAPRGSTSEADATRPMPNSKAAAPRSRSKRKTDGAPRSDTTATQARLRTVLSS
jgi:hypothetical protein